MGLRQRLTSALILVLCIGGIIAICSGWNANDPIQFCPTVDTCE